MYFYPARGAFVLFWVMSGHAVCTLLHLISHFFFYFFSFFMSLPVVGGSLVRKQQGNFFFIPDHAGWPTLIFVFSYPCCPRHCSHERCGWFNHWHLCLLKLCSISAIRGVGWGRHFRWWFEVALELVHEKLRSELLVSLLKCFVLSWLNRTLI